MRKFDKYPILKLDIYHFKYLSSGHMTDISIQKYNFNRTLLSLLDKLSRGEKRAFMVNKRYTRTRDQIDQLYHLLMRHSRPEAAVIARQLELSPHAFIRLQSDLYQLLLQVIGEQEANRSPLHKVQAGILICHALFRKRLFGQALKKLQAVKRSAEKNELFDALLEIEELERRIYFKREKKSKGLQAIPVSIKRSRVWMEKYAETKALSMAFDGHFAAFKLQGLAFDATLPGIADLDGKIGPGKSARARKHRLKLLGLLSFQVKESHLAWDYDQQLLAHVEAHPFVVDAAGEEKFMMLYNAVLAALQSGQVKAAESIVPEMETMVNARGSQLAYQQIRVLRLQLRISLSRERMDTVRQLLERITQLYASVRPELNQTFLIALHTDICAGYLISDNLSLARKWIGTTVTEFEKALRQDFRTGLRLLELLIYFQSRYMSVVDSRVRSFTRDLRRTTLPDTFIDWLLDFLRNFILPHAPTGNIPPGKLLDLIEKRIPTHPVLQLIHFEAWIRQSANRA